MSPRFKGYKYRLHELLRKLPVEDYERAMIFFPERLNIKPDTFRKWIYIPSGSGQEIPGKALVMMGSFFQIPPAKLFNDKVPECDRSQLADYQPKKK